MLGHKDSDGKFHPHSDSSKKLSSHQVEDSKQSSVNKEDYGILKGDKSSHTTHSPEHTKDDVELFKCPNCDNRYETEIERDNCDSQITQECFKTVPQHKSKLAELRTGRKDMTDDMIVTTDKDGKREDA